MLEKLHFLYFFVIVAFDVVVLLFMTSEISIYYKEAIDVLSNNTIQAFMANVSLDFFHLFSDDSLLNGTFARVPFLLFHVLNCTLLYLISLRTLAKKSYALLCVMLFLLTPGVSIQSVLISRSVITTFLALYVSYAQIRFGRVPYMAFLISIFVDQSSSILFLSLFFYSLVVKRNILLVFSMFCFALNMYIFSPVRGVPYSYFLDTVGIIAVLLSPALFLYYCHALYLSVFTKDIKLFNLIPIVGIMFTLLLSIRQEINIQSFIPSLIIGLPIMVSKLMYDIKIRLPRYRKKYRNRLIAIVAFLVLEDFVLFGNKLTYLVNPQLNFAHSFYGAKEIVYNLKKLNISEIFVDDSNLAARLRFYGIGSSSNLKLSPSYSGDFDIMFLGVRVASYRIDTIE